MSMLQWFLIILAADLVASATVAVAEKLLAPRKRRRTRKKLAQIVSIRKAE